MKEMGHHSAASRHVNGWAPPGSRHSIQTVLFHFFLQILRAEFAQGRKIDPVHPVDGIIHFPPSLYEDSPRPDFFVLPRIFFFSPPVQNLPKASSSFLQVFHHGPQGFRLIPPASGPGKSSDGPRELGRKWRMRKRGLDRRRAKSLRRIRSHTIIPEHDQDLIFRGSAISGGTKRP